MAAARPERGERPPNYRTLKHIQHVRKLWLMFEVRVLHAVCVCLCTFEYGVHVRHTHGGCVHSATG